MKPLWILENVDVTTDLKRLITALKHQNISYVILALDRIRNKRFPKIVKEAEGCVISYGSLQYVDAIQRSTEFIPGAWVDFNALRCDHYLTHLSQFSIHSDFFFLPLNILFQRWNKIFDLFQCDELFVKPNESRKSFSGQIIKREDELSFYRKNSWLPKETLCLISLPVSSIEKEWRFTATCNGVITGSLYEPTYELAVDEEAIALANQVAKEYFKNMMVKIPTEHPIMIDIGLVGDEYKLIELGGFACAGLYDCNYDLLVEKLTACAIHEWESYKLK